jgi:uncharacterized membrane protein
MTESTTQSGLSDNGAGALAYITFIPAIIFLVMPPYNQSPYVRFHAWQSILFNVASVGLIIVLSIVGAVLSHILFLGLLMLPIWGVVYLGLFILWIVVVMKAVNGQKFRIPLIAGIAESQAAK